MPGGRTCCFAYQAAPIHRPNSAAPSAAAGASSKPPPLASKPPKSPHEPEPALGIPLALLLGAAAPDQLSRLTGTIIAPDLRRAVFASADGPRIVAPGEILDGWKIDAIEPGRVTVSGPNGPREIFVGGASIPLPPTEVAWRNPCGRVHGFRAAGGPNHARFACRAPLPPATLR